MKFNRFAETRPSFTGASRRTDEQQARNNE